MVRLSKKAAAYLRLIGKTEDASVPLTRGYTRQADELKANELAVYIPISQGGCHVALTRKGLDLLNEVEQ
jgi:hypothetical protein